MDYKYKKKCEKREHCEKREPSNCEEKKNCENLIKDHEGKGKHKHCERKEQTNWEGKHRKHYEGKSKCEGGSECGGKGKYCERKDKERCKEKSDCEGKHCKKERKDKHYEVKQKGDDREKRHYERKKLNYCKKGKQEHYGKGKGEHFIKKKLDDCGEKGEDHCEKKLNYDNLNKYDTPHTFPILNKISSFRTELYNRPQVHKNADELRYGFYHKNFLNDKLKYVRNKYELKPIYKGTYYNDNKYSSNFPKHKCSNNSGSTFYSKSKRYNKYHKGNINMKYNNFYQNTGNHSEEKEMVYKINRELQGGQDPFVLGKGLYAPFKGLYMK